MLQFATQRQLVLLQPKLTSMMLVTEAIFTQQVLRATLPVLACFGTKICQARRAMQPALEGIATTYQNCLVSAMVIIDRAPLLAEQYGITASPTLIIFQDGGNRSGGVDRRGFRDAARTSASYDAW